MQDDFEFTAEGTTTPPESKNRGCGLKGCLGCLGVVIGVPLLLMGIGYYVLFHTSYPLQKMLDSDFDIDGKPVEVEGLSGSISSGFAIEKIVIQDDPEDSVIEGLTFRYNGIWDSIFNNRFVIEEFSADRSVIIVENDFLSIPDDKEVTDGEFGDKPDPEEAGNGDQVPFLFELRELNFKATNFKSVDGEIDIQIPLIHLAGLRIDRDDISLAELEITSDLLNLELADANPVEIDGQTLPFKQKVEGKVLPKIHPLVKLDIDFSFEFAAVDGKTVIRLTAFDGQMQSTSLPDETTVMRFDRFSPGIFLDPHGHIVPERISLITSERDKIVSIEKGEFFLGMTRFEIEAQKLDASDREAVLVGRAEVNGQKIEVALQPDKEQMWPPFRVEIVSPQKLNFTQQLSLIYFQRVYMDLPANQKSFIDDIVAGRSGIEPESKE